MKEVDFSKPFNPTQIEKARSALCARIKYQKQKEQNPVIITIPTVSNIESFDIHEPFKLNNNKKPLKKIYKA